MQKYTPFFKNKLIKIIKMHFSVSNETQVSVAMDK